MKTSGNAAPRPRKAAYAIRRADPGAPGDRAAIERLWLENLPGISADDLAERFDWLYLRNPAGPTMTWLAIDTEENDAIVGCASVVPRDMVVDGRSYRGGVAIDFAIDRECRSYGLAIRMQRAISSQVWESGVDILLGFPNAASRGVFQRIGFRKLGETWRGAQLLRSSSRLVRYGCPQPVARVAGFGIDLALLIRNALGSLSHPAGVRSVLLDAPDERWEEFWNRLSPGLLFAGAGDSGYLRWRYELCPGWDARYFCLLDGSDSLLGYLLFSCRGDVLEIDDIRVLEESLLKPLLDRFWREMRGSGKGVINISLVGSAAWIGTLERAGLVSRDADGWAGVLVSPGVQVDLPGLLEQKDAQWYLVDAEIDL